MMMPRISCLLAALASSISCAPEWYDAKKISADSSNLNDVTTPLVIAVDVDPSVTIKVRIAADGGVTVIEHPTRIPASIELLESSSSAITGAFGNAACTRIRVNLAAQFQNHFVSDAQKATIKSQARDSSIFRLRVRLNPLAETQALLRKISEAARALGQARTGLFFASEVEQTWEMSDVSFKQGALTPIFGEESEVTRSLGAALKGAIMPDGTADVEIGAYDLMCDLLSGRVEMNGRLERATTESQTPLFPTNNISALKRHMDEKLSEFASRNEIPSALMGLVVLTEALRRASSDHALSPALVVSFYEKLTGSDGVLHSIPADHLKESLASVLPAKGSTTVSIESMLRLLLP